LESKIIGQFIFEPSNIYSKIDLMINKKFNYVYLTTNVINNMKYIGSHSTDDIDDGYLGTGRLFLRAVKKYGKPNFQRILLKECNDIFEARELEEMFIKQYNTLYPNGYNLSPKGGLGFKGACHSEETIKKLKLAAKDRPFEKCSMRGKHHNEITKKILREKAIERMTKNPTMKGKKHSEETRKKMRQSAIGRHVPDDIKKKISETLKNKKFNNSYNQ